MKMYTYNNYLSNIFQFLVNILSNKYLIRISIIFLNIGTLKSRKLTVVIHLLTDFFNDIFW